MFIDAFVNGLLVTFLPALLLKLLGTFGSANTTFGDTDFGWFGILMGYGAKPGVLLGSIILVIIGLLLLAAAIFVQVKLVCRGGGGGPGPGTRCWWERRGRRREREPCRHGTHRASANPAAAGAPVPPAPSDK